MGFHFGCGVWVKYMKFEEMNIIIP